MRMERRRLVGGALFCALGACALSAGAEKVTITWGSSDIQSGAELSQQQVKWWDLIVQKFEETHPDVTVNAVHEDWAKVAVQVAAGSAPDVMDGCCSFLHNLGATGALVDLTPYIGTVLPNYPHDNSYWPIQYGAFNTAGRQWGLPKYLGTIAVYYNADLMSEAGLAPPSANLAENNQDWAQFETMAHKLTRVDPSGKVTVWGFTKGLSGDRIGSWLLAAGANYYIDGDRSRSALADPAAVQALDFLQKLVVQDHSVPTDDSWWSMLQGGKAAMMADGSWALKNLLGSPLPFKLNIMPLPIGPSGQRATLATIDGYAIPKSTKHLKEALEFLDTLTSPYSAEIWAKYVGLQPSRREVVPNYLNLMASINSRAAAVNAHVFTDAGAYAHPQYLYSDQDKADQILNAAYQKIFKENAPVKQTWYQAVGQLNNVLAGEK